MSPTTRRRPSLSDHVIVMNRGRIEQQGAPDAIYNEPANAFVADFIDAANLVPGEVLEVGPDTATIGTSSAASLPLQALD